MYCPNCLSKVLPVKRLNQTGYDPRMEEWECSNEFCQVKTFYVVPPAAKQNPIVRQIKSGQTEMLPRATIEEMKHGASLINYR